VLTKAITLSLASFTVTPTAEQREALTCVSTTDIAPADVCDKVGKQRGSTWAEVLRDIAVDVAGELIDP
jgi:hypothetical protein